MQHPTVDPVASACPDLIEPVVAYRQWRLGPGGLRSPFFDVPWRRGANTARCATRCGHADAAPGHACTCGLHAWYRPCPRLASVGAPDLVAGAVVVWGALELHPTGLRAEHAMVVVLALPLLSAAKRRRVREVADALEVPAVPARRLEATALAFGRPVPPELLPAYAPARLAGIF